MIAHLEMHLDNIHLFTTTKKLHARYLKKTTVIDNLKKILFLLISEIILLICFEKHMDEP